MLAGAQVYGQQGEKQKTNKTKKETVVKRDDRKGMGARDTTSYKTNKAGKKTTTTKKKVEKKNNDGNKSTTKTTKVKKDNP